MLRPSGVSSASEASWAASASCSSLTPSAGKNCVAWRLPRVMVPVLSSSSTSTSPAASTARPLVAMTLAPSIRLIPATPIADSNPPIVVGIRHTNSATSTVILTGLPPQAENGQSVTVASSSTMVSASSRMVRAISLGVLRLVAPSTIAIIRSRKVSPGSRCTVPPASQRECAYRRSPRRNRRRIRGSPAPIPGDRTRPPRHRPPALRRHRG